jgi:hypothetical protein
VIAIEEQLRAKSIGVELQPTGLLFEPASQLDEGLWEALESEGPLLFRAANDLQDHLKALGEQAAVDPGWWKRIHNGLITHWPDDPEEAECHNVLVMWVAAWLMRTNALRDLSNSPNPVIKASREANLSFTERLISHTVRRLINVAILWPDVRAAAMSIKQKS